MQGKNNIIVRVPRDQLDELRETFTGQGFTKFSISYGDGEEVVVARTKDGQTFRASRYDGVGFSERTISRSRRMSSKHRRKEAKRLSRAGLTQTRIAQRLGFSQRTISNDLRS
jgi:hypothetical protein